MKIIGKIAQIGSALWIFNVWFNRFDKDTGYRGGDATNMREEFEEYGLSERTMYAVGAAKVSLAALMLIVLGAIGMHVKVKDPVKRSLPALSVFTGATVSAMLNGGRTGQNQ